MATENIPPSMATKNYQLKPALHQKIKRSSIENIIRRTIDNLLTPELKTYQDVLNFSDELGNDFVSVLSDAVKCGILSYGKFDQRYRYVCNSASDLFYKKKVHFSQNSIFSKFSY